MDPTPWVGFADSGVVLESSLENLPCDVVEEDKRKGAWSWGARATPQGELWRDPSVSQAEKRNHCKGWLETVGKDGGQTV